MQLPEICPAVKPICIAKIVLSLIHRTAYTQPLLPALPVDPMLSINTPTLPSLLSPPLESAPTPLIKNPISVIADGIPPIPTKLLEKIRCWEYIDLATLTGEQCQHRDDPVNYGSSGNQVVIVESMDRISKKRKVVSDIFTWIQTYSILMAALTSDTVSPLLKISVWDW